jgi:hypothetical protein
LKSLVFEEDKQYDFSEEKQFLVKVLSISTLAELSIFSAKYGSLRAIASFASNSLTTLSYIFDGDIPNFGGIPQMFSVRCLYINVWSLKTVIQIFKLMPNLEKLSLQNFTVQKI